MPAIKYDIEIDDNRVFRLGFTWYDRFGNPVNITGYGAKIAFESLAGDLIYASSDVITIGDGVGDGTNGTFQIFIPCEDTADWDVQEGRWEFICFETLGNPEDNPISLIGGSFYYNKTVVPLT